MTREALGPILLAIAVVGLFLGIGYLAHVRAATLHAREAAAWAATARACPAHRWFTPRYEWRCVHCGVTLETWRDIVALELE